jgi:hypothetical protein
MIDTRVLAISVLLLPGLVDSHRHAAPAHVAVAGTEYAFVGLPATLPPGPTLFSFENRGKVRHEMSIARLRPGVTAQQVFQQGPSAAGGKIMADQVVGILIGRVGESSGGELLVDLQAGRRYLVVCSLKDLPDDRPHSAMGMFATIDVTAP